MLPLPDEVAVRSADDDEPFGDQDAETVASGLPGHGELLGDLGFGGQLIAGARAGSG